MTGSEASGRVAANPYVGPRPFEPGEKLYGREEEITELYYLWNAERIVLLHSPSGAGKSSLLQAGLLPRIKTSFDVWGPTRVNLEPAVAGVNRYALSAMQGFEQGVPERLRRPPETLARLRLAEYVETRPRRRKAPKSLALLFDQFEEVLTVDPLAEEAKREFFDQLGDLLRNPRVWALFVLREDYLAPLDPFLDQVPTHFRNRFRIDLLSLDGAREAIVNPALAGGREFPAADRLLHDLATMKVQQPDGSFVEQTGRHVEPVQLQVVCYRLWDAMPADDLSIDDEDLARFGDVTEALSGYYADSVRRISGGEPALERAIRDWFGDKLITAGGIRGQVLRGSGESEGLANDIVERLRNTHLVRAEERAGATWYELAHDRLIEPVQSDNAAWRAEHLSEVQQRATLWEQQGRPPGLLVKDKELASAERWSLGSVVLTEVETRFLEESRKAQDVADRERRQQRRIKALAVVASVVGALALVACVFAVAQMFEAHRQRKAAVEQREEADKQRQEAVAQREEAENQRRRAEQEKREADAAREEAVAQRQEAEEQRRIAVTREREARDQRRKAEAARQRAEEQQRIADRERQRAQEQEKIAVAQKEEADKQRKEAQRLRLVAEAEALAVHTLSMQEPAHRELAALLALQAYRLNHRYGGEEENTQIYNAMRLALKQLGTDRAEVLLGHRGEIRSLAVAPDGRTLASGSEDGEVRLTDLDRPEAEATVVGSFANGVRALAFSSDGGRLAAGGFDGELRVWDLEKLGAAPQVLSPGGEILNTVAFQPGGSRLAAGRADGSVHLWDLAAGGEPAVLIPGEVTAPHSGAGEEAEAAGPQVRGLAFRPDGAALAAASHGRGVLIWEVADPGAEPRILADDPRVRSVAFSHGGDYLAAGTATGKIRVWPLPEGSGESFELLGHTARVEDLEFHPERELLASASLDGRLRLWDVRRPDALPLILEGHEFWVWAAAFSPDGERLISGSGDREIHLWTTSSEALAEEICAAVKRNLTTVEWREHIPAGVEYEKTCPGLPAGDGS